MLKKLVLHPRFDQFVLVLILLNSITLGFETWPVAMERWGSLLHRIDRSFLALFTVEIVLKLWVHRTRYLRDPWGIFDILIVGISLMPSAGALSVLRSLRILRALRMLSLVPSLRRVVTGLLGALPGLGSVIVILMLVFYVAGVIATKLFGASFPEWFGSLGASLYTLFQVMTLESWSMGIVRPVMEQHPVAWVFFVGFILITTFTVLNVLIAVLVNSMSAESETAAERRAEEGHEERLRMIEQLGEMREELARLSSKLHEDPRGRAS
jgi:voltage-gated sodium channel